MDANRPNPIAAVITPGIYRALSGVELGIVAFSEVWKLVKNAMEERRDLTPEELSQLDADLAQTDAEWQSARQRNRNR